MAIKETSFEVLLDRDVALRIRFSRQRGVIIAFVVQLEYWIESRWYPIIRYDTAHGYAHCDVLKPDGSQEKLRLHVQDLNAALTYAQDDLRSNFRYYCERFRRWLQ